MRVLLQLLLLTIAAVAFSIPLTIAVDLALYHALADQLGNRSLTIAIDCIDKTEMTRTVGFISVLMLWSAAVLGIDRALNRFRRKRQIIIERCD
jgi:hypothetical protein